MGCVGRLRAKCVSVSLGSLFCNDSAVGNIVDIYEIKSPSFVARLPPGGQNSEKMFLFEIRSPSLPPGSLQGVNILKNCPFLKLEALLLDQPPSGGSEF